MTSRRRFPLALTTIVLACFAAPAVSQAGPGWLEPQQLAATSDGESNPLLVANAAGDFAATWRTGVHVYGSVRRAGAPAWSTVELTDNAANVNDVRIGVDHSGTFIVAWKNFDGAHNDALVSTLDPGSPTWDPSVIVSGTDDVDVVQMTTDSSGNAYVAFSGNPGSGPHIAVTKRASGQDAWSDTPTVVSGGDVSATNNSILGLAVAADDAGRVTVLYPRPNGGQTEYRAVTSRTDGSWEDPQTLDSLNPLNGLAALATGADGSITALWTAADDFSATNAHVLAAHRAAGSLTWEPTSDVLSDYTSVGGQLGVDADGDVTALWMSSASGYTIMSRTLPHGSATWDPPAPASAPGYFGGSSMIIQGPERQLYAVWKEGTGFSDLSLRFERFDAATNTWVQLPGVNSNLITTASSPGIGADASGNFAIGWVRQDDTIAAIIADGSAPVLGTSSVPETATVNVPFEVTIADATDRWSDVTTDVTYGADATVQDGTVTYSTAGTKTVTITATDTAGNTTSETHAVTVTDPPPPAPPAVKEKTKLPPVIPARLAGKKITITTTVPSCSSKFVATTKFGTTKYQIKLKLTKSDKVCTATGTITLKKTPSTRTKLRVAIGRVTKTGTKTITTLTTKRA